MAFKIPEYTERVAAGSAGAVPRVQAVEQYDFGRDLQQAGNEASRAFDAYQHTQLQDAQSTAARAAADLRMEMDTEFMRRAETAEPGAPNFTPDILGRYGERVNEVSEKLPSEAAREAFRDKMLPYEVQLNSRSLGHEAQQRISKRVLDVDQAIDTSANQTFASDPESRASTYEIAQNTIAETIASLDLPGDTKQKLYQDLSKKLSYASVQGDLRDRPEKVRDWLVQGVESSTGAKANTGVEYYSRLKTAESGGRNVGSDTSSAFGPYQFTASTWADLIKSHPEMGLTQADRFKPAAQEIAIRQFTEDNAKLLETAGLPPTNTNLYMMHFLGKGGGPRFLRALLSNPDADARTAVSGDAARANPAIFKPGRTIGEVYGLFGKKFGGDTSYSKPSGAPAYYADLTFENRDQLYGAAEAEMRRRSVQQNAAFKQRVDNSVAEFGERGASSDVPTEGEFVAAYGPDRGTIEFGEYAAATEAAKAGYQLRSMPLNKHTSFIESLKPEKGDPFYDEKLRGYYGAKQHSQQMQAAITEDAASFAVQYNPELKEALAAVSTVTPEDPAKAQASVQHYASMLQQEYDKLGVPATARKLVPKSYADMIASTLGHTMTTDNGARVVVGQLQAFKQMWGKHWPLVYEDMRDSMSAPLKVITSGIQPQAAMALAHVHDKSFDELTKVLPVDEKRSITEDLQAEFAPYVSSAGFQLSAMPHVNTLFEQGKKLTALYRAQGDSVSTAAERAYNDLLGFKYKMESSGWMNVRIPVINDFEGIEATLEHEHRALTQRGKVQQMTAPQGVKLSDEYLNARTRDWMHREGKWVTLPDDSGVGFVVGGRIWNYSDGRPIVLSWDELKNRKEGAFKEIYSTTEEVKRQEHETGYQFFIGKP